MASPTATEPAWLAARRERAAAASAGLALPDATVPGWEFTDLSGLDLDAFAPAPAETAGGESVFEDLPAPEGVTAMPLAQAVVERPELVQRHLGSVVASEGDPFAARNDAEWSSGLLVHVGPGVVAEAPVVARAVQAAASQGTYWRTLIVVEEGAQAEVWEQYVSRAPDLDGLFNTVTELVVGPGAKLRYVSAQALSEKAWIFGTQRAEVDRDGALEWVALGFGSARGKVRMETNLAGRGSEAKVTGAYVGRGRQHLDFDTTQEHAAPNTTSDLAFRGLLDGRSTAVWRGMIRVDPGAQQTDAFQESRNLLLSTRAHADAIPGLEIKANDVRCTHAAAVAQIDREQLFYLRAHGLGMKEAQRLVIEGFLQELVERFPAGALHNALSAALERRLAAVLGD
ncbi:MAG: Fe-S cluster assembly protein SufD [Solirubrobacteraceae bacterium]